MRLCSKCQAEKPPDQFRPVKNGKGRKDGLHSWCRECERALTRRYWQANRDECVRKLRESYRRNHDKRLAEMREYHAKHREERIEQMRDWRESNPETMKRAKKRWNQNNPEKMAEHRARRHALKMNAPRVEKIDRGYIYERDGGRCHLCGRKVPRDDYHLDHLIPLSRGGPHTHDNLALAHPACNMSRHAGRLPAQLRLIG